VKGNIALLCASVCLTAAFPGCNSATMQPQTQASGFQQTNLVSDTAGTAAHTDPRLINPWGIAFQPDKPFWIANNNGGSAKVFDASGSAVAPLAVAIPTPPADTAAATPTGIIANPIAEDFQLLGTPAQFLFATEDGTISTWATVNGTIPTTALLAIDHSAAGAVYKSLAILTPQCCREFLAVANFQSGLIETFDVDFNLLAPAGNFTDPTLPANYAPFNIQPIGNQVFITYAVQDAAKHDPVPGPGNGIVDIFDQEGNFVRRFASNGPLNAPWGVTQATANFGPFSNNILIANFGDGTINAFDPTTGNFQGQLKDATGTVIVNPGLWALAFRSDAGGTPDTLYFTAGGNEQHGLFAAIKFHN
jgi:uncharacterized protein (TIGR03118 family)